MDRRLHQRWTFNHFFIAVWRAKAAESVRVKRYWEIIPGNLKKAGWRCGCISSTDANARQFWVVAAEREHAGRFIVRADHRCTAYLELHAAIHRKLRSG